jgi:glycosyltransferase involved in cell wall biosynthesis
MSEPVPAVSVILPTHNRFVLFRRALDSVLGQGFRDLEVIVVDNACDDGSSAYLSGHPDPRVRVVRLERKLGASAARNAGLAIARAPLVSFQDDDDVWLPNKLERQIEVLNSANHSVGLCLAGYVRLTPAGSQDRYAPRYARVDFSSTHGMLGINAIATPAWLVRKDLIEKAGGFDEAMPARNDWELALRLSDLCDFVYVAEPLFIQDQRHQTTMAINHAAVAKAVRRVIQIHGHRWAKMPRTQAYHASLVGRHEITAGDLREGRLWLLRSLRLRLFQPNLIGLLALSVFGQSAVRATRGWSQRLKARLRAPFKT